MLEQFLINLPNTINLGTSLVLAWGMYCVLAYSRMNSYFLSIYQSNRNCDLLQCRFMWLVNMILFLYLLFGGFAPTWIADTFMILSVFYASYLFSVSISLIKWMIRKHKQQYQLVDKTHIA